MPTINPDGFAAANASDGCQGTQGRNNHLDYDLNSNFPDHFVSNVAPIQSETKAVMRWLQRTSFVLSASVDGGALVASYPFDSYKGVNDSETPKASPTPDDDVFQQLAKAYSLTHPSMGRPANTCLPDDPVFKDGITNGASWYPRIGGMQDYNYVKASCYEIQLHVSCCKYPPASQLKGFWEDNKAPLINYVQQVHMGVKGVVRDWKNDTVSGAWVTVKGRELVPFTTSKCGEYWKLLLPGNYTITVNKTGYIPNAVVDFEVKADQVTRLDVVLGEDSVSKGNNLWSTSTCLLSLFGVLALRVFLN